MLNGIPSILDYDSNPSFHWSMADQMLILTREAIVFQFFVAVSPGIESVVSGFCVLTVPINHQPMERAGSSRNPRNAVRMEHRSRSKC
jgi:hypothetical protein